MASRTLNARNVSTTAERATTAFGAILWLTTVGLMFGAVTPAQALNGQNAETIGVFEAPANVGGDLVVACPAIGGQLDGQCLTTDGEFLRGFLDPDGLRIVRSGDTLRNATVGATAFGSLTGTSAGDVVCWTFQRRGGGPTRSRDIKACASIAPGTCSGPRCRPTCDGINARQDNGICLDVAARTRSPDPLAYVFAIDTSRLGQSGSAVLTTCQGFVAQCAPADMAATGVIIHSTRPLDASEGDPYLGGRYW
jgi:hypothetical protein